MTAITSQKLADALREAGLDSLALQAEGDHFHDYLSPLDAPCITLVQELDRHHTRAARELRKRVVEGEFDASREEGDEWARSPEGQAAFRKLKTGE
jgi:hypothetical protein